MSRTRGGHICGCYFVNTFDLHNVKRYYLPQVELESHTKVTPVCFSTTLKQKFGNPHNEVIKELRYAFPLYDGVSVCAYTIRYGSEVLEGVVKQKEEAKITYETAISRGETAALLESLPAGVFGVTIGNIPPQTNVLVYIRYSGELKHDAGIDGLRYTLPTAIAPRYGDYPGELLKSNVTGKGIRVTIDLDMGKSAIRKVQSPSHPVAITMGSFSSETSSVYTPSKASASLTQGSTELGSDFVLQMLIDDISKPQAILEKHTTLDSRAIMTTFVPKFDLPLASPEIVFIADQSGSMSDSKNEELVAALQVFLKSLPFGVRFNICAFGSRYTYLWAKAQAYNEENLKTASGFVRTFKAQWGGTEMYEPVEQAFLRHHGDLPLEIMLLTDGEIWQEQRLFELINKKIDTDKIDARVFALGIGSAVSHSLCEGIARAGRGFAQYVVQNEETDAKILRMLRASLFPHTKDYSLQINFDDREDVSDDFEIVEKMDNVLIVNEMTEPAVTPAATSFYNDGANVDGPIQTSGRYAHLPKVVTPGILQAPTTIPPLFPYNRTNLYLMLGPDSPQKQVVSVTLRAQAPSGPLVLTIPVYTDSVSGNTVHQLAARKAIQELEEGRGWIQEARTLDGQQVRQAYESRLDELVEQEAVRLGTSYQIASKWTSFVAVSANGISKSPSEGVTTESLATPSTDLGQFDSMNIRVDAQMSTASVFGSKKKKMGVVRSSFGGGGPGRSSIGGGLFNTSPQRIALCSVSPPPPAPSGGLFGLSSATSAAPSGGLFGLSSAASAAPSGGASLFGISNASSVAPMRARRAQHTSQYFQQEVEASRMVEDHEAEDEEADDEEVQEEKPHTTPNTPGALLRAVIDRQMFQGYWQWHDELLHLLGINAAATCIEPNDTSATALVLAWFERQLSAHRSVWEMVALKARTWLATRISPDEIDKLVEKAGSVW